ncbi:TadE/TadG family type IV pilus assembly protein [Phenylobacterium sp.]|uniref:TadE/TadG family type IV pilus assembly protein n=1 Tax=Phenylobacterium sp. TaxID=1871053 RepID=UPI0027236266|nr:TadE/TadG family type IV pilus assembly protein [Phenylobacterium sp.]MDO8800485.1 pilus assembly protein [Phenylobacterium sp.]
MSRRAIAFQNLLLRFAAARRGTTAIEFAIIALPFCVMLFGIIELGMVFLVSLTLQNATDNAARQIRTGQFQTSGSNAKGDFKTLVCNRMSWLATPCLTKLTVAVQTFADFNAAGANTATSGTAWTPAAAAATCFSTGAPGDIVLVRSYYEWDVFTPLLDKSLVNMGTNSNKRLISTVATFRNEPYSTATPVGARCS